MKHINAADLALKSNNQLIALIKEITESLQELDINTSEYHDAIGVLAMVKRTLAARRLAGPKF